MKIVLDWSLRAGITCGLLAAGIVKIWSGWHEGQFLSVHWYYTLAIFELCAGGAVIAGKRPGFYVAIGVAVAAIAMDVLSPGTQCGCFAKLLTPKQSHAVGACIGAMACLWLALCNRGASQDGERA